MAATHVFSSRSPSSHQITIPLYQFISTQELPDTLILFSDYSAISSYFFIFVLHSIFTKLPLKFSYYFGWPFFRLKYIIRDVLNYLESSISTPGYSTFFPSSRTHNSTFLFHISKFSVSIPSNLGHAFKLVELVTFLGFTSSPLESMMVWRSVPRTQKNG